ncbi:MAG: MOSC domain-containing protein [Gemmatimonadales bacterium]
MTDVTGARIIALHAGPVRTERFGVKRMTTAICKRPVIGPIQAGTLGLEGDEQADRRYHGGPSRALCCYVREHQEAWGTEWGRAVAPGEFGENLTLAGIDETTAHIGDRFRIGAALVEVASARGPCGILAARTGFPDIVARIRENGWTGWYLRVLEPGLMTAGDRYTLESAHPAAISVAEAYRIKLDKGGPAEPVQRLLTVAALCPEWRAKLVARLAERG